MITRRSMFAGLLAGAMLHVMRPLERLLAKEEEPVAEAIPNPAYESAEYEVLLWNGAVMMTDGGEAASFPKMKTGGEPLRFRNDNGTLVRVYPNDK